MVEGTSKIREAYRCCGCIGEFQAAITQIGALLGHKNVEEVKWLQEILNDDVILYEEYLREAQQYQKHAGDQQGAAAAAAEDTATEKEIVENSCKKLLEEFEEFEEEEDEEEEECKLIKTKKTSQPASLHAFLSSKKKRGKLKSFKKKLNG